MTKSWLFLICAILFNVAGNFFMKQFSRALDESSSLVSYLAPSFIIGVIFFGINLVFYAKALEVLPLSLAYPVLVAVSLCLVTMSSLVLFGEHISAMQGIGLMVICLGVFLTSFGIDKQ